MALNGNFPRNTPPPTQDFHVHPHACLLCAQRKVKCDKLSPCSNCKKSSSACEYREHARPNRRSKRMIPEDDLHWRLDRAERLLKTHRIHYESDQEPHSDDQPTSPRSTANRVGEIRASPAPSHRPRYESDQETRQLITEGYNSRFIEKSVVASSGMGES